MNIWVTSHTESSYSRRETQRWETRDTRTRSFSFHPSHSSVSWEESACMWLERSYRMSPKKVWAWKAKFCWICRLCSWLVCFLSLLSICPNSTVSLNSFLSFNSLLLMGRANFIEVEPSKMTILRVKSSSRIFASFELPKIQNSWNLKPSKRLV